MKIPIPLVQKYSQKKRNIRIFRLDETMLLDIHDCSQRHIFFSDHEE